MSKKIKLISQVSYNVNLNAPEFHYTRDFTRTGQFHLIDKDILDQMVYIPSIRSAFEKGILFIDDEEARIEYGFEVKDNEGKIEYEVQILTSEEILDKLQNMSYQDFKNYVKDLDSDKQQRFVDVAVDNKFIDYAKCQYLKKLTGRDIIKIIEITSDDKEEE